MFWVVAKEDDLFRPIIELETSPRWLESKALQEISLFLVTFETCLECIFSSPLPLYPFISNKTFSILDCYIVGLSFNKI